jgi:DNA-binding transcriptional LysR family regulator
MEDSLGGVVKEIKVFLELGSTEAVKKAVEENLGISIVMECSVSREVKLKTLKVVTISGVDLKKRINVIHLKGKHLTPSFNEFAKFLRQAYTSLKD